MKKIIISLLLFSLLLLTSCRSYIVGTEPTECETLALALDNNIDASNKFKIKASDDIVAGTLISISEPWYYVLPSDEEEGKFTYTLTFKGKDKEGKLTLKTGSQESLPYEVNKFYKFDLKNIDKYSMQNSGAFMDPNMDALEEIACM